MKRAGMCQWSQACPGRATRTVRSSIGPGFALTFHVCDQHGAEAVTQGYHAHEPGDDEGGR